MKPEQLKPIVTRLTNQLLETLTKVKPELKHHFWNENPSFTGIRFLIEKILPEISKLGTSEILQILELAQGANNYFQIHKNSRYLGTCFVFVKTAIIKNLRYDIDSDKILSFFENNKQLWIKASYIESEPFFITMTDQKIEGFTKNTFVKFTAMQEYNGKISIYKQSCRNTTDFDLIPDLETDLKIDRTEILEAVKNEYGNNFLNKKCNEVETDFKDFSQAVKAGYENLVKTFDLLIDVLKYEIKARNQAEKSHYLHLKFDESTNHKIIQILYKNLNGKGKAFHTTESNFKTVFTPENTMPIKWSFGINAFFKLFFGFYNLSIDGFARSFEGLISQRKDLFIAISESFDFNINTAKQMPHYISGKFKSLENTNPKEMPVLWPIIEQLKSKV